MLNAGQQLRWSSTRDQACFLSTGCYSGPKKHHQLLQYFSTSSFGSKKSGACSIYSCQHHWQWSSDTTSRSPQYYVLDFWQIWFFQVCDVYFVVLRLIVTVAWVIVQQFLKKALTVSIPLVAACFVRDIRFFIRLYEARILYDSTEAVRLRSAQVSKPRATQTIVILLSVIVGGLINF